MTELPEQTTYPILRWACDCGRFVADASIESTDFRDDDYFYGIRTESVFQCSRCGLKDGLPRLIEVGEAVLPDD